MVRVCMRCVVGGSGGDEKVGRGGGQEGMSYAASIEDYSMGI